MGGKARHGGSRLRKGKGHAMVSGGDVEPRYSFLKLSKSVGYVEMTKKPKHVNLMERPRRIGAVGSKRYKSFQHFLRRKGRMGSKLQM